MPDGKPGHSRRQSRANREIGLVRSGFGCLVIRGACEEVPLDDRTTLPAAADVVRDATKPGGEPFGFAQLRQLRMGVQENFLHHILTVVITRDPGCHPGGDHGEMTFDQGAKGRLAAVQSLLYQSGVVIAVHMS